MSDERDACPVCGKPTEARLAFLRELAETTARTRSVSYLEVLAPTTEEGLAAAIEWRALVALAEANPPGAPS